jgi:hypothetical protein
MGSFDHVRIGELRIRAERAEARIERLIEVVEKRVVWGTTGDLAEWEAAKAWDGAPSHVRAVGMQRYTGSKQP